MCQCAEQALEKNILARASYDNTVRMYKEYSDDWVCGAIHSPLTPALSGTGGTRGQDCQLLHRGHHGQGVGQYFLANAASFSIPTGIGL